MAKSIFISTFPFGTVSSKPLSLLEEEGLTIRQNSFGRRMTSDELARSIGDADYLIAGTEQITSEVLNKVDNLKLIARVGVGLDNIPFEETVKRNIKVTCTPDAPTRAVAELTIGLMIDCVRNFSTIDRGIREGKWTKFMGRLLEGKTIGIIGVGRIGKSVARLLKPFNVTLIGSDLLEDEIFAQEVGMTYVSKEELYKRSDIITLHLSCDDMVRHLIDKDAIALMKPGVSIINTARGMVVNEDDMFEALSSGRVKAAAFDVFEDEPYSGKLRDLPNAILTAHIGAATEESRFLMEMGAAEEVIRFHKGEPLKFEVIKNL